MEDGLSPSDKDLPNRVFNGLKVQGFQEVVGHPKVEGFDSEFRFLCSREDDHPDVRILLEGDASEVETPEPGHVSIGNDKVRSSFQDCDDGLLRVLESHDLKPSAPKEKTQSFDDSRIVIDDEDGCFLRGRESDTRRLAR